MDTLRDYLNPERIYTDGLHDVGVSNLESTTPTVKESLAVRTAKSSEPAPVRENLTTAESAEKRRVGEPGYPTANGRQEKNGTGIEEIERGTLDLQVGTAEESSDVALNWFRYELTALRLWAKDSWLVEPLTLYRHEDARAIAEYFQAAIDALSKTAESAKMSRERAANVLERRIPEFEGLLHFRIGEYEQIVRDTITAIHVAIRALREGV
jgi:hypothetical protein